MCVKSFISHPLQRDFNTHCIDVLKSCPYLLKIIFIIRLNYYCNKGVMKLNKAMLLNNSFISILAKHIRITIDKKVRDTHHSIKKISQNG